MKTQERKAISKLGYSPLDTAEIVTQLNRLLSGYSVYQQKVRSFYWNISGPAYFDLRKFFKEIHKRAVQETDEIGQRIRLFDQVPTSTLSEYIALGIIKEEASAKTSFEMAKIALSDIRVLLGIMEAACLSAQEISDNGTQYMLKSFIYHMENDHRDLTAWVKQDA